MVVLEKEKFEERATAEGHVTLFKSGWLNYNVTW